MHALKEAQCAHDWDEICMVYHRRFNIEGTAVRCSECGCLGLRKTTGTPLLANGRDMFQVEYRPDGRPSDVCDVHL